MADQSAKIHRYLRNLVCGMDPTHCDSDQRAGPHGPALLEHTRGISDPVWRLPRGQISDHRTLGDIDDRHRAWPLIDLQAYFPSGVNVIPCGAPAGNVNLASSFCSRDRGTAVLLG
jgi:hypothetical protein